MAAETLIQLKTKTTAGAPTTTDLAAQEPCIFSPSTGEIEFYVNNDDDTAVHLVGVKINRAAGDPTANDDITLGYTRGSIWVNTTDDGVFICGDNTDTAAVWTEIGTGSTNSFATVAGDSGTNPTADSSTDTLTIAGGTGIDTVGANDPESITIAIDSTVATLTGAQTLSNKVLTLPEINDTSADHQYIFAVSELTLDRTVTLPLLTGNDTFVFEAHTQTLTNKTLTTPVISGDVTFDEATNDLTLQVTDQATGAGTAIIPDLSASDTFVFLAATQSLTNKTISDSSNTISGGTI